jgi:hypothetical protein
MQFRLSVLIALCSFLLPLTQAFAQAPPDVSLFNDDFGRANSIWQPVSGTWAASNGTYGNAAAGSSNISVVTVYESGIEGQPPTTDAIGADDFTVNVRINHQGTTDAQLAGLVYGYQDPQNYFEVVISALGRVTMRTVMNGVAVEDASRVWVLPVRNTWLQLQLRWVRGVATLKIDGFDWLTAEQPEFTQGKVGLVTHNTPARFDVFDVSIAFGDQGFFEPFNQAPFVPFTPQSGQWTLTNQTYNSNAVQQTSVSLAPIHLGSPTQGGTTDFTFRARMVNPYAGAANLIGVVFNYESSARYAEVVFSPTGVAKVNFVINGVTTTLATANYGGKRNVAFDVTLQMLDAVSVLVDGKRIFSNVSANPSGGEKGGVGLITHWAPARFDNVRFDHGVFQGCSETFSDDSPPPLVKSGLWDTEGGTLNDRAVNQSDIATFNCLGNTRGDDAGTNFNYRARVLNEFGASGNLVGLVLNYTEGAQGAEYYEVVFSSTMVVLYKVMEGVRTAVNAASYNLPRNTWFNVQVVSVDNALYVSVNDFAVMQNTGQGVLVPGRFGVITHWSKGRFDDVVLTSLPPSYASEL